MGGWGGWVGGPGHYVVTPTQVGVELGCDNKLSSRDMAKNKFHWSKSFLLTL